MRSMTGFGTDRVERDGAYVSIEISSVNSRHTSVSVNLSNHPALEQKVSNRVKDRIERGKVKISLDSNILDETRDTLNVDHDMVRQYMEATDSLENRYSSVNEQVNPLQLFNLPGVVEVQSEPVEHDADEEMLLEALDGALDELVEMRKKEGEQIASDLERLTNEISEELEEIRERVPETLSRYREQLREKISEILDLHDEEMEERLENELKMYADKCDISEEVMRVESHLQQVEDYLDQSGSVGKSLEFLVQEIQREVNTIGAKANDATISQLSVDIKSKLEQCREQINNVE
ncbi:MAG: YicC/YloC family endoribonuclease [bacterium]